MASIFEDGKSRDVIAAELCRRCNELGKMDISKLSESNETVASEKLGWDLIKIVKKLLRKKRRVLNEEIIKNRIGRENPSWTKVCDGFSHFQHAKIDMQKE